jgi:hypothetical protein
MSEVGGSLLRVKLKLRWYPGRLSLCRDERVPPMPGQGCSRAWLATLNRTFHASNVRCPISSSVYNPSTLRITRETGTSTLLRLSPLVFRAQVSEQFWETVLVCTGSTTSWELALLLLFSSSSSSLESDSDRSSLESCLGLASGATEAREGIIEEIEGIMGALEGVNDGLDGPLLPRGLLFLIACVSGESLWVRSGVQSPGKDKPHMD